MTRRAFWITVLAAGLALGPWLPAAQANEIFIPLLVYRTGAYAPSGIPSANGFNDYFNLLNERDGGINGVEVVCEECEMQYDTKQGVECYERLKSNGEPGARQPFQTGITYQLIPKAPVDKVVIHSAGYGMTASADGRWFPWVFNFPMTYWSQASAFIKYVGQQEGGLDKLKGKKIVHVFHNSPYGKEANPTLEDPGAEARLRADAPGGGSPGTGAEVDVAPGPTHQPRLDLHLRLGRHEPGGGQGGRGHRLPDGPRRRQLVDGDRGGRGPGGRRRQGLQVDDLPRPRQQLQGPPGHPQARVRQGEGRLRQ